MSLSRYTVPMTTTCIGPVPGLHIAGMGTAFPPLVLDNAAVLADIAVRAGKAHNPARIAHAAEALQEELGLHRRAWTHRVGTPQQPGQELTAVDLGVQAARKALDASGLAPDAIGAVLVATSSPHRMTGTVSAAIAAALGLRCMAMDTRAGCASGLFALSTAALYVQAGVSAVLLIGAETFSKVVPPDVPAAVISLADGAAAMVLTAGESAVLSAAMETDGAFGALVSTPGPMPPTVEAVLAGGYQLSGQPGELKQVIPLRYQDAVEKALDHAGLTVKDIDRYVPHQAGAPVIRAVCAAVGIPLERAWISSDRHGNVGAAGWMVALAEALEEGFAKPGHTVALAAVGGGMSWACVLLRLG